MPPFELSQIAANFASIPVQLDVTVLNLALRIGRQSPTNFGKILIMCLWKNSHLLKTNSLLTFL